jgi:holin-like protein
MIGALALLLGCQLAGEVLRRAAHLPVPGPVLGMLLLTGLLLARQRLVPNGADDEAAEPDTPLDRAAGGLIRNMGLLFVPAGVGVIAQAAVLKTEWLPIVAAVLGSTLLGLIVTALVMHWLLPRAAALEPAQPAKAEP